MPFARGALGKSQHPTLKGNPGPALEPHLDSSKIQTKPWGPRQEHLRPPDRETKLGVELNMKGNAIRNDVMPEIWNEAENEMTREMRLWGAWGAVMPQEARIHA